MKLQNDPLQNPILEITNFFEPHQYLLPNGVPEDTVKHYRIHQLYKGGFFIERQTTFETLQELVNHYSMDADGLCVNLRKPCHMHCSD